MEAHCCDDRPMPYLDRVDPRARVLFAAGLVLLVASAGRFATLGAALAVALLCIALSGNPWQVVLRRLVALNAVLLLVAVLLPFTSEGTPVFHLGAWPYTRDGLLIAAAVVLKGNGIVLASIGLLGTLPPATLGHVLSHFRMPAKLVHLVVFTVRYLDVFRREHARLRAAMRVRGFQPGVNRHTYQSFGYLAGMLLVRSLDRSERIVAAMKCRGFVGRFYLLDHFAFSPARDVPFGIVAALAVLALAWVEWA
jgi:cobalt/nickel transport system permease protein